MEWNQGLVVSSLIDNIQLANYVLLMNKGKCDENPSVVLSVHKKAFELPPELRNEELSFRKNQERRLSKPLTFGEAIEWKGSKDSSEYIYRFERISKLYDFRCVDSKYQIKVEGAIDPHNSSRFWCAPFPKVNIPKHKEHKGLPNVMFHAWINIHIDDDRMCSFDFDTLISICPTSDQESLADAPWNREDTRYRTITCFDYDSSDDFYDVPPPKEDELKEEYIGVLALAVDPYHFYSEKLINSKLTLAIYKDKVVTGSRYKVNIVWNRFDKVFMVGDYVLKKDLASSPVDESGRIRTMVKATSYFGVYKSDDFGLLDDPSNILSMLHLAPFSNQAISVAIKDGMPSNKFRFRIVDLLDKKGKMTNFLNSEEIKVENVLGIALENRMVFSSSHAQIMFKIPQHVSTLPSPGTFIKFDALYDNLKKHFEIVQWRKEESLIELPCISRTIKSDRAPDRTILLIKARVKRIVHNELKNYLISEDFGLIDDRGLAALRKSSEFDVWVTPAVEEGADGSRIARTMFEVATLEYQPATEISIVTRSEVSKPSDSSKADDDDMKPKQNNKFKDFRENQSVCSFETVTDNTYETKMAENDNMTYCSRMSYTSRPAEHETVYGKDAHSKMTSQMNDLILSHRPSFSNPSKENSERFGFSIPSSASSVVGERGHFEDAVRQKAMQLAIEEYEAIKRINSHGSRCNENSCSSDCQFLTAIATYIQQNPSFYKNLKKGYPAIAMDIKRRVETTVH